jgi:lipoprotein-releasing system ATP-binding protein
MTVLSATSVSKTYRIGGKSVPVLDRAGLVVEAGEHVAVIGASGAGKSTLLNLLGGLDRPDTRESRVEILGRDIYAMPSGRRAAFRARHLGFVFQAYHLMPEMDCVENVMLPAFALGRHGRAERARAEELLERVGLAHRLAHKPLELSGGEQQRVAIARALMNDPELLLADEPTGNLDAAIGAQVLDLLFSLGGEHAIVMVTHSPATAERCGRVLTLAGGALSERGVSAPSPQT